MLGWYHKTSLSSLVKIFLLTVPRRFFFRLSFLLFMFCVCHAFFVCSLQPCDHLTFSGDVLGQVRYLIASICSLPFSYFSHDGLNVLFTLIIDTKLLFDI